MIVESFPSTSIGGYGNITYFTEYELLPWAQHLEECPTCDFVEGKKEIRTPDHGFREFTGAMIDGKLIGNVVTSDGEDPVIYGISFEDQLYGRCKCITLVTCLFASKTITNSEVFRSMALTGVRVFDLVSLEVGHRGPI